MDEVSEKITNKSAQNFDAPTATINTSYSSRSIASFILYSRPHRFIRPSLFLVTIPFIETHLKLRIVSFEQISFPFQAICMSISYESESWNSNSPNLRGPKGAAKTLFS